MKSSFNYNKTFEMVILFHSISFPILIKIVSSESTWSLAIVYCSWANNLALQSLEDEVVRKTMLRLASLKSWYSLSYGRFQVGSHFMKMSYCHCVTCYFWNFCDVCWIVCMLNAFWVIGLHLCRWSFVLIQCWSRNGKGC